MAVQTLIYKNVGWNVKMAFFMAFHGFALFAGLPILVIYGVVDNAFLAGAAMAVIAAAATCVPFVRSLFGKVWVEDGVLYARNPFRTIAFQLDDVKRITTRALWQNFYVVGAVEQIGRQGWPKLIPVPGDDVEKVTKAIEDAQGRLAI